jgi:hypothetical protein
MPNRFPALSPPAFPNNLYLELMRGRAGLPVAKKFANCGKDPFGPIGSGPVRVVIESWRSASG